MPATAVNAPRLGSAGCRRPPRSVRAGRRGSGPARAGLPVERPLLPLQGIRTHSLRLDPEIQLLLDRAPRPQRPLDGGETCPWQDARGHCTARDCRPLGCRVYYCDPAYEPSAHGLSERYIARLKALTDKHGLPWNYAPLHRHLEEECDSFLTLL